MNNVKCLSQVVFHYSGPHNRAYFRKLQNTRAGRQINPLTGLSALESSGTRIIGTTYDIGRNQTKRDKLAQS